MPMINSKQQIAGLIQIGNSEKSLAFTESDINIARLIAFKIANFITETRENHQKKAVFQKQAELSILRQNLENQSVKKVLTLANQLFQSEHTQPLQAVGYFVKKTEKYLRQTFNCQFSQLLLVDHERQSILSFDVSDQKARLLKRGEAYADYSLTNALIKGGIYDPLVWPLGQEGQILINDESQQSNFQLMNFYSKVINPQIDCPLTYQTGEMPPTYLAMAVRDQQDPSKVLGVI